MEKTLSKPLVSVVIPTYNRAEWIGGAVESVLSQEFQNYELIVVDDGSTDETPKVLERYSDRIRMIRQANCGVSAARNTGVASSNGDFIAFLDSDDLWLPGKLSRQVVFFQQNSDARICQTNEIWIRNGVRVNPGKRHRKRSGQIFAPSLRLCLVSPSAVMLRKKLFDDIGGFDEDLPACEDYDLWLRIGSRYPIYLIDEPLIVKRGGHEDQLSKTPKLDVFRIRSLVKLLDAHMLAVEQQDAAVRTLIEKCDVYANGCRKRGRMEEAQFYERLANRYVGCFSAG